VADEKKVTTKPVEKKATTTKKVAEKKTVTKTATTTKTEAKKVAKTTTTEAKKVATTEKVEKKVVENNEEIVATATVKYARISSRKIAIVANLIRGKNVDEAMAIIKFTPKAGSEVLEKLLKSAIANAENNNQMNHSKLYIAEIYSNQGPTLRRIRAAAKGSAVRIRKRTSHTTIVLKERA
jgi:large subunit ribosomal protein L22